MLIGSHIIKTWSSTQASLALSSGEAEYYGVVRATGVGLGHQALMRDAGIRLPLRVWTDCRPPGLRKAQASRVSQFVAAAKTPTQGV